MFRNYFHVLPPERDPLQTAQITRGSQTYLFRVFNSQLSQLKKEDVIALGKAIDGFLSSDVGRMTQAVVFAAFPEMKVVKDVAMPVMRQFIKKVTD